MKQLSERKQQLLASQHKAEELFAAIERHGLIVPEKAEKVLNDQVYELAFEMFGIRKYWHKRIVRAGKNTLLPYKENPPDLIIQPDDILFFDFGPVFEEWEADFGRTYVIGSDVMKHKLKHDIEAAWYEGKEYFDLHYTTLTGADFYSYISSSAKKFDWHFGNIHCGHLIGNFPHEIIQGDEQRNYLHPNNHIRLSDPDIHGNPRDWILEIHFINKERTFGGFFEQLLSV
ncbi:MAG: aminopeptidase P family protein [Ignavibacteriales bacterium]|nr:aminopeptidase P family protein [Ignavibacteriales bacterium]